MTKPPVLNIIYDNRRSERFDPLMEELTRQGIDDYVIWNCVEHPDVVTSINLSHKQIVGDAMHRGLPYVCIAEDDLFFPAPDGWRYFLDNVPETYDLYAAATYVDDIHNKNLLCGFHLYIVSEKFYEQFLSIPDNKHIDTRISDLDGDFHVCRPFAALQRVGWSANHKVVCNYNGNLTKGDIYYGAAVHNV